MRNLTRLFASLSLALFLALTILSPLSYAATLTSASSSPQDTRDLYTVHTGVTTNWARVRTAPNASSQAVKTYAAGTTVSVYASVSGQGLWAGNTWYRVSNLSSAARYIYSGLVSLDTGNNGGTPSSNGKVIVVSLSHQWLYAYQNGRQVFNAAVMTGRPALPTPTGTYHVFAKLHPTTFYSPWPPSSPYYYPPTYINYALEWGAGGFFLHDSWWHSVYGPGTNGWHYDPQFGWQWGTHGCVAMPYGPAQWLYNWAPIGTTVQINL